MRVIAVDDDRIMLEELSTAIKASQEVQEITEFISATEALEWVNTNQIDMAFLGIDMRDMNGLILAERIMKICPKCKVVFCTNHPEYAMEAFQVHASGYLLKPITARKIQKEIDFIMDKQRKETKLTVRCFGSFEVLYQGKLIGFKRSKTKELLAFLVDRKGFAVTAKQICSKLWQDNADEARNVNYLYQLLDDLRHSLRLVGAEGILNRNRGTYAINIDMLDCDYYRYLEYGKPEFLGEYMTQYSWAEETTGLLWRKKE